jgi:hypothetical protein
MASWSAERWTHRFIGGYCRSCRPQPRRKAQARKRSLNVQTSDSDIGTLFALRIFFLLNVQKSDSAGLYDRSPAELVSGIQIIRNRLKLLIIQRFANFYFLYTLEI